MAVIIPSPDQYGKVTNFSSEINLIPNRWGLMSLLNIFKTQLGSQRTVTIPRKTSKEHLMEDRNWDEGRPSLSRGDREILTVSIPHFPLDASINPNDINGRVDFDALIRGGMTLETVEAKRAEILESLFRAHSLALEAARMQLFKDGSVFAPRGTVKTNFYNEYGITRKEFEFDMKSTIDPLDAVCAEVIGYFQDTAQNGIIMTDFLALCSPKFFQQLISNPFIREAYLPVQMPQRDGLLVGRLDAGQPFGSAYQEFRFRGITFIEVRGGVAGQPYVDEGKAYCFPRGTDTFETWFAPANRLDTVNQIASPSYAFEYIDEKKGSIDIMSETNFLNIMKRPDLVVTLKTKE